MKVRIVNKSSHALPAYETKSSAGMDLRANLENPVILKPLEEGSYPQDFSLNYPMALKLKSDQEAGWLLKKVLAF